MRERLHYSPQALLDLDEIFDFYAHDHEDEAAARRIVANILAAARQIPEHPTRFPPVGSLPLTSDAYRFVVVGSYLIFFRTEESEVYIDRILNRRRDFASLLGL